MKLLNSKLFSLSALCLLISTGAFAWGGSVAIVYSPNAGIYSAYAGSNSRCDAETAALVNCGATCAGVDVSALENKQSALIETYMTNGWVALAVAKVTDANGARNVAGTSGQHANENAAEESALDNCNRGVAAAVQAGAVLSEACEVVRSLSSFDFQADLEGIKR
jgi:hypothetical protein